MFPLNENGGETMAYKYQKVFFRLNPVMEEDMTVSNILNQFGTTQERNKFIIQAILDYSRNSGRDYVIGKKVDTRIKESIIEDINKNIIEETETNDIDKSSEELNMAENDDPEIEETLNPKQSEEMPTNKSDTNVMELLLSKLGEMESNINSKLSAMENRINTIEQDEASENSDSEDISESSKEHEIETSSTIQNDQIMDEPVAEENFKDDVSEIIEDENDIIKNEFDAIDPSAIKGTFDSLFNLYNK